MLHLARSAVVRVPHVPMLLPPADLAMAEATGGGSTVSALSTALLCRTPSRARADRRWCRLVCTARLSLRHRRTTALLMCASSSPSSRPTRRCSARVMRTIAVRWTLIRSARPTSGPRARASGPYAPPVPVSPAGEPHSPSCDAAVGHSARRPRRWRRTQPNLALAQGRAWPPPRQRHGRRPTIRRWHGAGE